MFYRFELLARRAQSDTPGWEKMFSHLYGLTSDYGASMARPFVALAVLIVGFAGLFYGFAASRGLTSGAHALDLWQAVDFSLANVFKPLSAISNESLQKDTIGEKLLNHAGYGWTTGVRALSILQSLLAIVLAFLFALGVRRRFQIS